MIIQSCRWLSVLGAMSILLAGGCGLLYHEPEQIKYYTLSYESPAPSAESENSPDKAAVIRVGRIHAKPPYDTNHIVYAQSPYQRSKYVYHKWITTPADMLTSFFIRDIEAFDVADIEISSSFGKAPTYNVKGIIIDFYENNEKARWEAVLALRLTLVKTDPESRGKRVILSNTYREIRELEKNNPHELARSMSKAMEAVSKQFLADLHNALK